MDDDTAAATARLVVLQLVPALHVGGVERGVLEVDAALSAGGHTSLVGSSGGPLGRCLCGRLLLSESLRRRDPFSVLVWNPLLLARWMGRHRVDVLHARSRCLVLSALLARALSSGSKVVATWHGMYSAAGVLGPLRRALNGLLLRADRLILPSASVWRHVRESYGGPEEHWRLVHRGVETAGPADCAQPPREGGSILLPGRVSRSKGQLAFVEAMALLHENPVARHAVPHGVMIGAKETDRPSGRYRRCLDEAIADATRRGVRLSLTPYTHDMGQAYAQAAVVAMPSTRPEAFGRVLVEAVAARRLVVAFHHGAAGELASALWERSNEANPDWPTERRALTLLQPGVLLLGAVFLVAPGDVDGLSRAFAAAVTMPAAEREWRVAAAQKAVSVRFGLDAFVGRTLAVYGEIS